MQCLPVQSSTKVWCGNMQNITTRTKEPWSLPSILISLGDVGKKQVLYCFKIDEENVLYCSSCNMKVHQMVQHTIGRPRMPYNQASACIKFEILKKATKIYNKSDGNLKNQIDEISQGCSEEVCLLQR